MATYRVSTHIDAPPERVWGLLADWEGSAAWMVDATTVEVLSGPREGVGTTVRAVTRIAGLPLVDVMEVTAWEPLRRIEVEHRRWPILGPAWFAIAPDAGGTRFEWVEDLRAPLGAPGELAARALRRPIERILRRSVVKLRALAEGR